MRRLVVLLSGFFFGAFLFYGQLIASLVRRAAVLYEVGVMKRGDAR